MKARKMLCVILVLVLCLALTVGCGGKQGGGGASLSQVTNEDGTTTVVKDTLVIAVANEPTTLDPYGKNDSTSAIFKVALFDTLFSLGADGTAQPAIAESYEYLDDTTLTIKLRQDVKFHNGETMTAEDVMYSIQQTYASSYLNPFVAEIDLDASTIDDESTITLRLTQVNGSLLNGLCYVYIVPKAYHTQVGAEAFAQSPVGSGAFVYKEWVHGDRVDYTANKDYWGTVASVNNMTMRVVAEAANRTIELETGGVDIAMSVSANDLPNLENNQNLRVVRAPSWNNCFIGFNCSKEPFTNTKLRQAMSMAIDTASIVKAVYGDTGSVAKGPISPAIWGYDADLTDHVYDPEGAKALLAEAGFADGVNVTISVSDTQLRMDIAEMVQNQLAAIGVTCKVDVMENATYLDGIVNESFEMYILTWPTYTGDADYGLYDTFHSESASWANTARYSNPEVDKLLEEGAATLDTAERLKIYKQVQEILVEECPWIYLWDSEEIAVCGTYVNGLEAPPSGRYQFNLITFES